MKEVNNFSILKLIVFFQLFNEIAHSLPRVQASIKNGKGPTEINMRNRNFVKKCFIYEISLTLRNLKGEAAKKGRWNSLKGMKSVLRR